MPIYWGPDMSEGGGLLNARETAKLLGISEATFYRFAKLGRFEMLKVSRPYGQRIYSRVKVEQYLRGEAMAVFGRGSRRVS